LLSTKHPLGISRKEPDSNTIKVSLFGSMDNVVKLIEVPKGGLINDMTSSNSLVIIGDSFTESFSFEQLVNSNIQTIDSKIFFIIERYKI